MMTSNTNPPTTSLLARLLPAVRVTTCLRRPSHHREDHRVATFHRAPTAVATRLLHAPSHLPMFYCHVVLLLCRLLNRYLPVVNL